MREALRRAGTGRFSQRIDVDAGDGLITRLIEGQYDLGAGRWKLTQRFETTSATARAELPDMAELVMEIVADKTAIYLTMPGWPASRRGRWLKYKLGDVPGAAPSAAGAADVMASDGQPQVVDILMNLTPSAAGSASSGVVLTGSVPVGYALAVLGLNSTLAKQGVDVATLTGSAVVEIDVDANGLPSSLKLDGSQVTMTSALPKDVGEALRRETLAINFGGFHQPVSITIPGADKLIDPSEVPA
jgi:hypothetical protein